MSITEIQIENIESCDEYSLRHHADEVLDLVQSYRELVWLLEDSGVMQLDDEWAERIQRHVGDVEGIEP
jgi:hypothetical protein